MKRLQQPFRLIPIRNNFGLELFSLQQKDWLHSLNDVHVAVEAQGVQSAPPTKHTKSLPVDDWVTDAGRMPKSPSERSGLQEHHHTLDA